MKRCPSCNVNYDTDRKSCPFCRDILEEISEANFQSYPKYKETKTKRKIVEKIFIFLSIIAAIVCVISNYYDYVAGHTYLWSVVVLICIVLLWALIRGIIISNRYFAERYLFVILLLQLMFMSIELVDVKHLNLDWSITYMMPFLTIAYLLTIVLYSIINSKKFADFFIYMLLMSLFAITEILFVVFNKVSVDWPVLASSLSGLFVIIGMFIFPTKTVKEELKKRLRA
jgi:hypothetical protein